MLFNDVQLSYSYVTNIFSVIFTHLFPFASIRTVLCYASPWCYHIKFLPTKNTFYFNSFII